MAASQGKAATVKLAEGHPHMDGDLSLRKIAWALCSDAQEQGYDHGASPTMIGFDTPFPHCPRHLGIALAVRNQLRRDWAHEGIAAREQAHSDAKDRSRGLRRG